MIQKLRRKFVSICMALVTIVLVGVFLAVYLAMKQNIEDLSRQVLHQVIQENSLYIRPHKGGDRVFLPYFTVNIWGDTVYFTGGTYDNLEDTSVLEEILNDCLRQSAPEGTINSYGLRYLRQENGLFQRIAFVDMSMEQAMLRNMMLPYLAIGVAALCVLLGISILLSRWATRPVERAWAQQKQFLSDASHELKTPLTVILSNAELLDTASLRDRPARWVDNIHSEATRMKSLVEEMLTLARADNRTHTAVLTETSLSDVTANCTLAFEPVAFEAGKSLDYHIDEDILIMGDQEKLRQLISIFLDNAIKYSPDSATITLTLKKNDRQAQLTVSNPGEPIPAEQLPHVFERFYRADASRGEKSGFGLGLSIAAAITQEHNGSIWAESDTLSTRFYFTMPLKR